MREVFIWWHVRHVRITSSASIVCYERERHSYNGTCAPKLLNNISLDQSVSSRIVRLGIRLWIAASFAVTIRSFVHAAVLFMEQMDSLYDWQVFRACKKYIRKAGTPRVERSTQRQPIEISRSIFFACTSIWSKVVKTTGNPRWTFQKRPWTLISFDRVVPCLSKIARLEWSLFYIQTHTLTYIHTNTCITAHVPQ